MQRCADAFVSPESWARGRRHCLSHLVGFGRHTITGLLRNQNRTQQDWSADYRFYAQDRVDAGKIFQRVRAEVEQCGQPGDSLVVAMDDSILRKTGRRIFGSGYRRDPMSPPFQVNFVRGLRVLQISAAVRQGTSGAARLIPIDFQHAALPAKPHKKAPLEQQQAYEAEKAKRNINLVGAQRLADLRRRMDQGGSAARRLLATVDGRFTNSTVLRQIPERTVLIGRVRKDAVFFHPPQNQPQRGRKRKYGQRGPTPEALLKDPAVPWEKLQAYSAGQTYEFKIKTLAPVYSAMDKGQSPLRLLVIEPVPYRNSKKSKLERREPAYLILTPICRCRNCSRPISGVGISKLISGTKKPFWESGRPKCARKPPTRTRLRWPWPLTPCCFWPRSKRMGRRASPTPFKARAGTSENRKNEPPPMNWSTSCATNSGPSRCQRILPASAKNQTPARAA
jgi:hypothetical protein